MNEDKVTADTQNPGSVEKIVKKESSERLSVIGREFSDGFDIIRKYPRSVTVFGSARFEETHPYYEKARQVAARIAQENIAVVTGGGQGIMEAANRGAYEAGGDSIGFNIQLPFEQTLNGYVTDNMCFHYFFSRKVLLAFSAEAFIFFPGGFGTLDEFFEIITLVQTYKIPRVPIILVGNEFWGDLTSTIEKVLLNDYKTISPDDLKLYTITEDTEEMIEIIKNAPLRQE